MASQSQGDIELRVRKTDTELEAFKVRERAPGPSLPAEPVRSLNELTERDTLPDEPTAREIEAGASQTIALAKEYTGQDFPEGALDEETLRILHALHEQRQGWSQTVEDEFRCSLQTLFPDTGGSKAHGPL